MKLGNYSISGLTDGSPVLGIQDLDSKDSLRNALGTMMRDRVAIKRTIELAFGPLNKFQAKDILEAVSPVEFSVTYFEPQINANRTAYFYVGDRSMSLPGTSANGVIMGLKFKIVEV